MSSPVPAKPADTSTGKQGAEALRNRLENGIHTMWQGRGLISTLLLPLSWPVAIAARRRRRNAATEPAPVPVIVVGNLYVGGTGKTPVTEALVQALQDHGWHPGIISRGYGSRIGAEPRVGQGRLNPALYGDEPALLAETTGVPVAVHPQRMKALTALLQAYPSVDIVVSDDGLQHSALPRDIEIVVQDTRGIGNGRLLPAGPLREPADRLATVDYVVSNEEPGMTRSPPPAGPRSIQMRLQPQYMQHLRSGEWQDWSVWLNTHQNRSHSALAAIGRPARFFAMLEQAGLSLQTKLALADHYPQPAIAFPRLHTDCILITPKDAVKCRHDTLQDDRVWVVHAAPLFDPPNWLDDLHTRLRPRQSTSIACSL